MKRMLVLMLCVVSCGVYAEDVYKCVQDGKLTISNTPCPSGATSTVVTPDAPPDASSIASNEAELTRLKQLLEAMERERLGRSAAYTADLESRRQKAQETYEEEIVKPEPVVVYGGGWGLAGKRRGQGSPYWGHGYRQPHGPARQNTKAERNSGRGGGKKEETAEVRSVIKR